MIHDPFIKPEMKDEVERAINREEQKHPRLRRKWESVGDWAQRVMKYDLENNMYQVGPLIASTDKKRPA